MLVSVSAYLCDIEFENLLFLQGRPVSFRVDFKIESEKRGRAQHGWSWRSLDIHIAFHLPRETI